MLRFDVPQIDADSLFALNRDSVLILDVRSPAEYATSHVAGAIRLDPGEKLPTWLDTISRQRQVTVYCSVGYRSENAGRLLNRAGFTKVSNLYGSLFDWVDRGYPVVDSSGRATQRVHTYNKRWSELVTSPSVEKVW